MIDRTFIQWNALLVLFALLFLVATLLLGPSEQPKDPARPKALVYHPQRHEALSSEPGPPVRERETNEPDPPPNQATRYGSSD